MSTQTAVAAGEPARCVCGHTAGQHYRSRGGAPLCVYPCGCAGFRPREADGPRHQVLDDVRDIATRSLATWLLGVALAGLAAAKFLDLARPLGVLLYTASIGAR